MSREHFTFTGTAREYFGIWIVNVLLTIITLGVYSAWAKVRRQRYFYGNTWLAGANFDYHARPVRILIGRMIVLAVLVAYNLALQFQPILGGLIAVALIFAAPWFIMRGLRFNARVTSYRNIRFDFTGKYGGGFLAYVLGVALIYGSGGILAPLASQWMWGYTLDNLRYADRPIKCEPRLEKLYRQWWLPALVLVGGVILLGMVVGLAIWAFSGQLSGIHRGRCRPGTLALCGPAGVLSGDDTVPDPLCGRRAALPGRHAQRRAQRDHHRRAPRAVVVDRSRALRLDLGDQSRGDAVLARAGEAMGGDPHGALSRLGDRARHDRGARRLCRQRQGFRAARSAPDISTWKGSTLASEPHSSRIIDGQIVEGQIVEGLWRAPGVARAKPARLSVDATGIASVGDAQTGEALSSEAFAKLSVSDRVGSIPRRVDFADGSSFETRDNDGIDRLLRPYRGPRSGLVHELERFRPRLIVFVALVLALSVGIYRFAVPVLVEVAVLATPPIVPQLMSRSLLASLDGTVFEPSGLSQEKQKSLTDGFDKLAALTPRGTSPR